MEDRETVSERLPWGWPVFGKFIGTLNGRKRQLVVGGLLLVHAGIMAGVILQPLDVNRSFPGHRSILWPFFSDTVHRVGPGVDFFAVYHAGRMVLEGKSPYDLETDIGTPYFFPFRYLPSAAFFPGALFALCFSPRAAYIVWALCIEAVLLAFALFLRLNEKKTPMLPVLSILLLAFPVFLEVHMGQMTLVSVALFLLGLGLYRDGSSQQKRMLAFLCLLFALVIKPTFLYAIPFLLLRERRLRTVLLVSMGALTVIDATYFAWNPVDLRIFRILNFTTPAGGMDTGNYSPVYLVHLILSELSPWEHYEDAPVWMLLQLRTPAFAAAYLFLLRKDRDPVKAAIFLLILHFITYIHVWEHHMSAVLAGGLFYLIRSNEPTRPIVRWGILICAAALALPGPFILFDGIRDPMVSDPGIHWPSWMRMSLAAFRAIPLVAMSGFMLADIGFGEDRERDRAHRPNSQRCGWP